MKTVEINWKIQNDGFFVREAFNTLRTNILFCGKSTKAIVITSCLDNEGKSTISLGLARGLAENGEHVLFLDADLRKSVFASKVKSEGAIVGLSQILSGQVKTEDAIYASDCNNLDVVFAGPFPPNPAELLSGKEFRDLVVSLKDRYDHIIIDAAPLGLVVDASAIAASCDGSILLINKGQIKSRMAQNVKRQLGRSGCPVLGVIMNQTSRRGHKSKYGYYYGGRSYRSYYRYGYDKYGYGYGSHGYGYGQNEKSLKSGEEALPPADKKLSKKDEKRLKKAEAKAAKEAKKAEEVAAKEAKKAEEVAAKEAKKAEKKTERQERRERLED